MSITVRKIRGKFHATIKFWDGVTLEFYNRAKFNAVCRLIDDMQAKEATA